MLIVYMNGLSASIVFYPKYLCGKRCVFSGLFEPWHSSSKLGLCSSGFQKRFNFISPFFAMAKFKQV